jgi:hypothetical protein
MFGLSIEWPANMFSDNIAVSWNSAIPSLIERRKITSYANIEFVRELLQTLLILFVTSIDTTDTISIGNQEKSEHLYSNIQFLGTHKYSPSVPFCVVICVSTLKGT